MMNALELAADLESVGVYTEAAALLRRFATRSWAAEQLAWPAPSLARQFIGIERERKYFDIACERIARAQAQGQLLPPEPVAAPEQQTMEL
jgi:hypothetical protein